MNRTVVVVAAELLIIATVAVGEYDMKDDADGDGQENDGDYDVKKQDFLVPLTVTRVSVISL